MRKISPKRRAPILLERVLNVVHGFPTLPLEKFVKKHVQYLVKTGSFYPYPKRRLILLIYFILSSVGSNLILISGILLMVE